MLSMVALRCGKKTIYPWKELLSAVISVKDDWDTILLSHSTDMEGSRNGTGDGSSVVFVIKSLSTIEL